MSLKHNFFCFLGLKTTFTTFTFLSTVKRDISWYSGKLASFPWRWIEKPQVSFRSTLPFSRCEYLWPSKHVQLARLSMLAVGFLEKPVMQQSVLVFMLTLVSTCDDQLCWQWLKKRILQGSVQKCFFFFYFSRDLSKYLMRCHSENIGSCQAHLKQIIFTSPSCASE